jgi:hypothetical protein
MDEQDRDNIRQEMRTYLEEKISWEDLDQNLPSEIKTAARTNWLKTLEGLDKSGHTSLVRPLAMTRVEISERTAAICTDGTTIWINPAWWTSKPEAELRHTAGFMSLSLIFGSIARGKAIENVDHWRWETACNLVINRNLIDQGIGVLPDKTCFITSITAEMTSEEVYETLKGMTRGEIIKAVWPLEYQGRTILEIEGLVLGVKDEASSEEQQTE